MYIVRIGALVRLYAVSMVSREDAYDSRKQTDKAIHNPSIQS
jgi:hypothetical protein